MSRGDKAWVTGMVVVTVAIIVFVHIAETRVMAALSDSQKARLASVEKMLTSVEPGDFIQFTNHRLLMVTVSRPHCCNPFGIEVMGGQSREYRLSLLSQRLEVERVITPADPEYAAMLTAFVRE